MSGEEDLVHSHEDLGRLGYFMGPDAFEKIKEWLWIHATSDREAEYVQELAQDAYDEEQRIALANPG